MQLAVTEKSADEGNFDKMKAAYDSCLDEDRIKKAGAAPLMRVLDDIKETYATTTHDSHALGETITLLAKYGIPGLVSIGTGADDTDPDTVVISVSAPYSFGLPSKERYEDDALVEKYRKVVIDVLSHLYGGDGGNVYGEVVELEKKLAAASPDSEDRDDVTVNIARTMNMPHVTC